MRQNTLAIPQVAPARAHCGSLNQARNCRSPQPRYPKNDHIKRSFLLVLVAHHLGDKASRFDCIFQHGFFYRFICCDFNYIVLPFGRLY